MHVIVSPLMRFRVCLFYVSLLIGIVSNSQQSEGNDDIDTLTKDTTGAWRLIQAHCTSCHSATLITQQRLNRAGWGKTIRRMQSQENLWDLGDLEPQVLDYLTKFYGANDSKANPRPRRLPLGAVSEKSATQ